MGFFSARALSAATPRPPRVTIPRPHRCDASYTAGSEVRLNRAQTPRHTPPPRLRARAPNRSIRFFRGIARGLRSARSARDSVGPSAARLSAVMRKRLVRSSSLPDGLTTSRHAPPWRGALPAGSCFFPVVVLLASPGAPASTRVFPDDARGDAPSSHTHPRRPILSQEPRTVKTCHPELRTTGPRTHVPASDSAALTIRLRRAHLPSPPGSNPPRFRPPTPKDQDSTRSSEQMRRGGQRRKPPRSSSSSPNSARRIGRASPIVSRNTTRPPSAATRTAAVGGEQS